MRRDGSRSALWLVENDQLGWLFGLPQIVMALAFRECVMYDYSCTSAYHQAQG